MRRIICLIALASSLSACAPKTVIVDIDQTKDLSLNCEKLRSAILSAEFYKNAARDNDKFMARYIFPPTGFMAMYNINKAEGNATKRIEHLNILADKKGCNLESNKKYINPQLLDDSQYYHYSSN